MPEGETTRGPYWLAPEVDRYVYKLIEESCLFPDLQSIPIMCLFTDKDMKVKGRLALAKIKKATDLEIAMIEGMRENAIMTMPSTSTVRPLPAPAWLIVVNYDIWLDLKEGYLEPVQGKTVDQKEALIFHELSHVRVKENEKTGERTFGTCDHDFMGFYAEVFKYGAWLPEYVDTLNAIKGEALPIEKEEEGLPSMTVSTEALDSLNKLPE